MTAADDDLQAFLGALDQLPPFTGVTFRGCADNSRFVRSGQLTVLTKVTSSARDLDTATEGRTTTHLYAILSRTGRDITPFSARPGEEEVVFLPGSVLLLERTVEMAGFEVRLVTEIEATGDPVRVPDEDVHRFEADVAALLTTAADQPAVPFDGVPGKFSGDLS